MSCRRHLTFNKTPEIWAIPCFSIVCFSTYLLFSFYFYGSCNLLHERIIKATGMYMYVFGIEAHTLTPMHWAVTPFFRYYIFIFDRSDTRIFVGTHIHRGAFSNSIWAVSEWDAHELHSHENYFCKKAHKINNTTTTKQ